MSKIKDILHKTKFIEDLAAQLKMRLALVDREFGRDTYLGPLVTLAYKTSKDKVIRRYLACGDKHDEVCPDDLDHTKLLASQSSKLEERYAEHLKSCEVCALVEKRCQRQAAEFNARCEE